MRIVECLGCGWKAEVEECDIPDRCPKCGIKELKVGKMIG